MFERYTEKARRVIFFGRYEASAFGSPCIETEHLLLGLLREDKALTNRFLRQHSTVEEIRKQIEAHTTVGESIPTNVDLPLSDESKRVLAYSAEEAEGLGHKHIGTEHLLLGLLREEKTFAAAILHERGVRLSTVRAELAGQPDPQVPSFERVHEAGEGCIEFIGADGVRIAVAGISRSAPVPRAGEMVLLELQHGQQRFRVRQVQYDYRLDPPGSPHAANVLFKVRVYLIAAPTGNESTLWSHST
jgi:hypothetical protein